MCAIVCVFMCGPAFIMLYALVVYNSRYRKWFFSKLFVLNLKFKILNSLGLSCHYKLGGLSLTHTQAQAQTTEDLRVFFARPSSFA